MESTDLSQSTQLRCRYASPSRRSPAPPSHRGIVLSQNAASQSETSSIDWYGHTTDTAAQAHHRTPNPGRARCGTRDSGACGRRASRGRRRRRPRDSGSSNNNGSSGTSSHTPGTLSGAGHP
ncbi:hypothetical protein DDE05_01650, partial [Streptomyces cavourensis]